MTWIKKKISDIITIKKGSYITKNQSIVGPYPVVLGGKEPAYYINKFNHTGKAIVISRSGASAGFVSYWNEPIFITDGFLIEPNENVEYNYLYYLLKNNQTQLNGVQGGAAIPHVTPAKIGSIDILVPPYEVQCKIAEILSAYDRLIENNQKQIRLLEEYVQRQYMEIFLKPQLQEKKENAIDSLAGWKNYSLSQLFSCVRGKSYTSDELCDNGGTLLVNLKNLKSWGGYKREAEKRIDGENYHASQKVKFGDIIMAVTDMTQERRLVGHVAIVPNLSENAVISMDLIKIIPNEMIPRYFLYSLLRFSGVADIISNHANGTNVLHLKPDAIMDLTVFLPKANIMEEFDKLIFPIYKKIEILETQSIWLKEARDRLLPKLMSGEIEV